MGCSLLLIMFTTNLSYPHKNTHYGLLERGNNVEFMEIMAVLGNISSTFYRVCISRLLINSVLAKGRIQYFKEQVGVGGAVGRGWGVGGAVGWGVRWGGGGGCGGAGVGGWKAWGHWGILYIYIANYHNVYVENSIYFK